MILTRIAVMLAMVVSLVGTTSQTGWAQQQQPILVSIDMWVGFGPWVVGKEKGLFEKRGLKVEPIVITGTGEKNAAMAAKRVQARSEGLDSILLASNQDVPGTVILVLDESNGGDGIVATRDIKRIADLKGKKVGFQTGLPGHFFLLYLLHGAGLTQADISPQIMDSASAGSAFLSGKLDAAVTWEPWLSRAAGREGAHLLASTRENAGVIVDVLAVQPEFLRNRPEDVRKLALGWFDSVQYCESHPAEANQIMAKFFRIPVSELEGTLRGVRLSNLKRNRELFGTAQSPGQLYKVGAVADQIWVDSGVLKGPSRPIPQTIDRSVIDGLPESTR